MGKLIIKYGTRKAIVINPPKKDHSVIFNIISGLFLGIITLITLTVICMIIYYISFKPPLG